MDSANDRLTLVDPLGSFSIATKVANDLAQDLGKFTTQSRLAAFAPQLLSASAGKFTASSPRRFCGTLDRATSAHQQKLDSDE